MNDITSVKSEEELKTHPLSDLVKFYNQKTGSSIKKFRDKNDAAKRCWPLVQKTHHRPVGKKAALKKKGSKKVKVAGVKGKPGRKKSQGGVTQRIFALIKLGKEPQDIVSTIRSEFPKSKADVSAVYWCKSKLKKEGLLK